MNKPIVSDGTVVTYYYKNKNEEHTHTWSAWKYNNDAVYNSSSDYKDGTQTRTCSACGESETKEAPNTALLRRRVMHCRLKAVSPLQLTLPKM